MTIQTIEFKDVREGDYSIIVRPIDKTDRVQEERLPNGLWYHYDVDKYTLKQAKEQLLQSAIHEKETEVKEINVKLQSLYCVLSAVNNGTE